MVRPGVVPGARGPIFGGMPAAWACPDCPTSRAVLAAVLDQQFWTYLVLIPLPLLVVGLISALLYRIGQEGRAT